MAQIFPKWCNLLHFLAGIGAALGALGAVGFFWYYGSPKYLEVGYRPVQPVAFSHKMHAGDLGMDCRYCHNFVEKSHEANVPPTQTCMNCHAQTLVDSELVKPIIDSWESGQPIEWLRVHKLPDYAYFDHSVHLNAGVGCASCHNRIDQMEVVMQAQPLSMGWCLDCHRNPTPHLRDLELTSVTQMDWQPPANQAEIAQRLIEEKNLNPRQDCSACHR